MYLSEKACYCGGPVTDFSGTVDDMRKAHGYHHRKWIHSQRRGGEA